MAEQVREQPQRHKRAPEPEATTEAPKGDRKSAEELKAALDAILDDIDSVLEENAAEFVEGYVQQGGE